LRRLKDEIPHGVAVEVTAIKERPQGNIADVDATIYCEKKTHKAIIIGKDGAMLKRIGTAARYEIEDMLGIPINLSLWVKVRKDWRDHPFDLKELGYTEEK
jgi:GTP-binding protein Era